MQCIENLNEPLVQSALTGLYDRNIEPMITHYNFCTNGSRYAGEAGIPTIGFGPSKKTLAHTRDERIALNEIEKALEGYAGIISRLYPMER